MSSNLCHAHDITQDALDCFAKQGMSASPDTIGKMSVLMTVSDANGIRVKMDVVTCFEYDKGIYDLYSATNVKGLYLVDHPEK